MAHGRFRPQFKRKANIGCTLQDIVKYKARMVQIRTIRTKAKWEWKLKGYEWAPDGGDGGDGGGYGDIDLEEDIIYYFALDNAEGLKSLFTHPAVRNGTYCYCRTTVLQQMCIHRAVKCATALLDGKLGIKVDVNRDKLLHLAAFFMSPQLVKLFLRYGARTDVQFTSKKPWDLMRRLNGMLPLNIALDAARGMVYSDLQKPLFTAIVSLCRPSLKSALAANKLLVESYNNIEEFALYYAMEGKLVELAVLLIVAREKVLNGRMMIPQFVRDQILSLIGEQVKLAGECKHREVTEIQQKMIGLNSTALLLEVFERAGHTIGEYLQSQQPGVERKQVEKDVASILEKAGFKLKAGQFEFNLGDWLMMNYCSFVRTPIKFLQALPDISSQYGIGQSPRMRLMQQTNVSLPQRKVIASGGWSLSTTSAFHGTVPLSAAKTNQVSNSILGFDDRTSFDSQVKKEGSKKFMVLVGAVFRGLIWTLE
ncbi:hypothetical protein Vadar_002256 [Vaccinium darrowii]|uniref:Uncharacterized protein n=1 Tax=Vaccinium darrowii TaxID=229202 RepID=A0ACB7XF57_9ERIC|nr:hypothetical protein Vadar_002256 [Vaccinium darrowii]